MVSMKRSSAPKTATVTVTEEPNRVEVVLGGAKHAGSWDDSGEVEADEGSDARLLEAAVLWWSGEEGASRVGVDELEAQGCWEA